MGREELAYVRSWCTDLVLVVNLISFPIHWVKIYREHRYRTCNIVCLGNVPDPLLFSTIPQDKKVCPDELLRWEKTHWRYKTLVYTFSVAYIGTVAI